MAVGSEVFMVVVDLVAFTGADSVDFTAERQDSMAGSFTAVAIITAERTITAGTRITTEVARTITAATTDTTTVVTDRITMAVTMAPVSLLEPQPPWQRSLVTILTTPVSVITPLSRPLSAIKTFNLLMNKNDVTKDKS